MITLMGGFGRKPDELRADPGVDSGQNAIGRPISIYLGTMKGAVDNREVFRRCLLPDCSVVFKYAGLARPVEGVPLEEVYQA